MFPSNPLWGRYQIQDVISRDGGMADIFLVSDGHRQFAAKVLKNEFLGHQVFQQLLLHEADVHSQLKHPNIVEMVGNFSRPPHNPPGILLEYIQGDALSITQDEPYPIEAVVQILNDVAKGLEHLHQRGFAHCDIKPSNILYNSAQRRYQLSDFGISQRLNVILDQVRGTTFYMSPEQVQKQSITTASDVYSLGLTIYELASGFKPYTDKFTKGSESATQAVSHEELRQVHIQEIAPRPSHFNPNLSPAIDKVLLKALDKDPLQRYQTVMDFAREFERAATGQITMSERPSEAFAFAASAQVSLRCTKGEFVESGAVPIDRPSILIGRSSDCQIEIDEAQVSRRHALLAWDAHRGEFFIEDQGSHLGTRINGQFIFGPHYLQHNELISIGEHNFRFESLHPQRDAFREESPYQSFFNVLLTALTVLYLMDFLALPWVHRFEQSATAFNLLFGGAIFDNPLTMVFAIAIAALILINLLSLIARYASADLEEMATQGGSTSFVLAILGLRSTQTYLVTGRLLFFANLANFFLLIFLNMSLSGERGAGIIIAHILSIVSLPIAALMYPRLANFLGLGHLAQAYHVYLDIYRGPLQGGKIMLKEFPFTIGRSIENNRLILNDSFVSRYHAVIERVGTGYLIMPHNVARNPISVGQSEYQLMSVNSHHPLRNNDIIQIGSSYMRFKRE